MPTETTDPQPKVLTFKEIVETPGLFDRLATPIEELNDPLLKRICAELEAQRRYDVDLKWVFGLYDLVEHEDSGSNLPAVQKAILDHLELPATELSPVARWMFRIHCIDPEQIIRNETGEFVFGNMGPGDEFIGGEAAEMLELPTIIPLLGDRWKRWIERHQEKLDVTLAEARTKMSEMANYDAWGHVRQMDIDYKEGWETSICADYEKLLLALEGKW